MGLGPGWAWSLLRAQEISHPTWSSCPIADRDHNNRLREARLIWTTVQPPRSALRRCGYHVVEGRRFLKLVARAKATGAGRSSLANPAAAWLALLAREARLAVLDLPCRTVADLWVIHGYLVEPAFRRRCRLLVHTERDLEDLNGGAFIDPDWRYPWTLERLRYLAQRQPCCQTLQAADEVAGVTLWERWRRWWSPRLDRRTPGLPAAPGARQERPLRLDAEQTAAVRAGDGVVQVIAPAGSGKTSVLIERVKELLHRGVEPPRILCTSFNKEAKAEIQARLAREGVVGIEVRSFHGLGWTILRQEQRLRPTIGLLSEAQWRRLAAQVKAQMPDAVWLDAAAAQEAISTFKLSRMIPPEAALAAAATSGDARARTVARLYALYEDSQRAEDRFDFDDLIAAAVGLLQQDAQVRRRWQARFTHVLVDEYQDIEPAQALLVGLLAAPQDALFCVGDEDQCIYAWRRATVQRVVELDQVYPGLERYPLVRNYRCGVLITTVSRRLIEHNRRRFRKPLIPGVTVQGEICLHPRPGRPAAAALVAEQLQGAERGQAVVLARTSLLLREVAQACAERGISFDGPAKLLAPVGAAATLVACLRVGTDPHGARAAEIELAMRVLQRSLSESAARALLADLARETAAPSAIARLRFDGGLDQHFAAAESSCATERTEVETLARAQDAARGMTPGEFADHWTATTLRMRSVCSELAVELGTIHGAKGREWDRVILYGIDQGQFPHARSLVETDAEDGLEDERRLFYVALTRARIRLDIVYTERVPSQFLCEAGLVAR